MVRSLMSGLVFPLLLSPTRIEGGEIPPEYPRVRGEYQLTKEWKVSLPGEFAKRFEKSKSGTDLVLWKKGMTCWTAVYNQKEGETPESTYAWRKAAASKEALEIFEFGDQKPMRFGQLLHEKPEDDHERWALYTFTFGESGHVSMAIYFDRKEDLEMAKKIWLSIAETKE